MIRKVIKWHNVETDGLPPKDGYYLCTVNEILYQTVNYSTKHKLFNVSDDDISTAIPVTYWAELPQIEEVKNEDN